MTPGTEGFAFTKVGGTPFSASTGQILQFDIFYTVTIDPAPVIPGAKLSLDPPSGNVDITELFCNDSNLSPSPTATCLPSNNPLYSITVTTTSPNASITFTNPAAIYQTVGIIFTVDGTNGPASFDGIDTATFVTPEPASVMMVGLAMLVGGYKLRKQRRK